MKIIIREWAKCPKAIWFVILNIVMAAIRVYAATEFTLTIPKVIGDPGNLYGAHFQYLVIMGIVTVIADGLRRRTNSRGRREFYTATIDRYTKILTEADYEIFTKHSLANITHMQNFINDAATAGGLLTNGVNFIVSITVMAVRIYQVMPSLLIPMIGACALVGFLVRGLYTKLHKNDKKTKESIEVRNQILENIINGFTEMRVHNMGNLLKDRCIRENHRIYDLGNGNAKYNSEIDAVVSAMHYTGLVIAIIYAANMVMSGALSIATAMIMVTLTGDMLYEIQFFVDFVNDASSMTSMADAYEKFMREASDKHLSEGTIDVGTFQDSIQFRNVNFAYGNTDNVLRNLSMTIRAGERIGICGRSGDGKTTILKLLCGFYENYTGEILIDDVPLRDIRKNSYYSHIGLVSQDVTIFPGTIWENVTYGFPNALETDVVNACEQADLMDFINSQKDGFKTEVGPRGVKLSGGQRQRIALARIFLKNPSIIILDEATSALDSETERNIQRAVNRLGEDRSKTVITVAHRLTTIENSDRIYVIEKGSVVESGSHKELMEMNGVYAAMRRPQKED